MIKVINPLNIQFNSGNFLYCSVNCHCRLCSQKQTLLKTAFRFEDHTQVDSCILRWIKTASPPATSFCLASRQHKASMTGFSVNSSRFRCTVRRIHFLINFDINLRKRQKRPYCFNRKSIIRFHQHIAFIWSRLYHVSFFPKRFHSFPDCSPGTVKLLG